MTLWVGYDNRWPEVRWRRSRQHDWRSEAAPNWGKSGGTAAISADRLVDLASPATRLRGSERRVGSAARGTRGEANEAEEAAGGGRAVRGGAERAGVRKMVAADRRCVAEKPLQEPVRCV